MSYVQNFILCFFIYLSYIYLTITHITMSRPKADTPKNKPKTVRVTELIEYKAEYIVDKKGYGSVSDYLRMLLLNDIADYEKQHGVIVMPAN